MHIRGKRLPLFAPLLVWALTVWCNPLLRAQAVVEVIEKVRAGIELHDAGKYKEALSVYQELLDAKVGHEDLLWYEMGYTYYAMGKFDLSIHFMDKVLRQKAREHAESAFMVKASALEHKGKTKQCIATFRKAIQEFPNSHLLHYNLAISLSRSNAIEEAVQLTEQAIRLNMQHLKSHELLSQLQEQKGELIPSLLPLYWILWKDPDSRDAKVRLVRLVDLLKQASLQSGTDRNAVQWTPMVKALYGSNQPVENQPVVDYLLNRTQVLANTAQSLRQQLPAFYTNIYLDKLIVLEGEALLPFFCEYLCLSDSEDADSWVEDHEESLARILELMD